ncbi:AMP-binding protein [Aeromicrobium fastidiosum]|uniref:AMP-binding protein n=1 Tax=Aeromicrobium fastidiosum TaxID=52699 RepID=A0A641ATU2_9ACTN|nr:AMP-binding protein [Aeromicrobium fastidiosum]KAA1380653.1 AMP-binding protein [Aeromicrobium fastidiosum]MBP2390261.1 acyl-CoA synthetase (AMP-forming)/AMP-acid ligase II [Aeromicrobium fastidiosum]
MIPFAGTVIGALDAALSSRVVAPVGPRAAVGLAKGLVRHQASPAVLLAHTASRWPDRAAVIDDDGTVTARELYDRVRQLAGVLHARGIGRGSTVGLLCRNHAGFVEAAFATLWVDADLVLLNTDFAADQLADVVGREGVELIVHDSDLQRVVTRADLGIPALVTDGHGSGTVAWACDFGHPAPPSRRHTGRLVILTSGTTGTPQGSPRRSQGAGVVGPLSTMLRSIGLRSGDPVLVLPPLFHGLGLAYLVIAIALGCPVVLMRHADAAAALRAVERHRVRVMFVVPVMLHRLLDVPADQREQLDLTSLHAVPSGAAPLTPALAERFMDAFGDVLLNMYGSTEIGWSTIAGPADLRTAPGTVGRPLRGVSVRIVDDLGREVPTGEVGRIVVRSSMNAPAEALGDRQVVDGHVSTGDVGHLDAHGRLFVDGRDDDMIVSGGENVFPGEVEDLLHAHPAIRDVTVHGVPDEEYGQRLRAVVVAEPDSDLTPDDVRAHVRDHLARFKVPRDVQLIDELQRSATGKVRRGQ